MSNETDLDWLARNVHEWSDGMREVLVCYTRNVDALIWSCVLSNAGWITKEQWLARRAELQNKPSWNDVPEWAEWLAQDEDGRWFSYADKPSFGWASWCIEGSGDNELVCSGELLGDWRDTLEQRPEQFKPFTSIEDNQEQDMAQQQEMKQDNGWFERGELPPVGIAVQLWHGGTYAYDCELIAKRGNDFVLWNLTWDRPDSADCMMCEFKPIPTEREELESMLRSTALSSFDNLDIIAGAIIAAGFRKEKK